ncbi:hypothetical protein A2962_04310 [Candidatus Woesebacteria bacterium RIFCSPLOWO2_01_FULL_39_61]|uniref:Uncharacterized protein n=1 Tax=Candidatus Woesebacteria bacterium RIFCSPHIGHO2_02_FULL_39_13 TaxID=1802505 RepID=A0A1F7YY91_9BACT|nr:MAG: hypothetical protein A2692_05125 [Candidatus Woesebacteria bacterium RIFCSPHIGHO2_01_FULL_39_95]OGM32180.1 MAG: hypothetical protein A3D01_02250 [Candidatus Woesebacteria bacterium RIFCSPHIGHO2_02_FULL_39_13]OGM36525.1 MAG: hypothetical protein A3E13_04185 [Candidatus Woesebacteria bacterium RIFCSPHIGHO2_12_FULL_40_20]OGM65970.1 MAG: hypothetical protein A2962_04310 [Candidatus Woesebacteria bacterium RIFCSPLOWO2_01_FULL_39_61]OGM71978.1 MAG: hypothetical protein A3H19_00975 [Candidatus
MTKPEKIEFDHLPNPFDKPEKPEITGERVLEIVKKPDLLNEMNLAERLRFTTEAFRLMISSPELRDQVIQILKEGSSSKNE